MAAPRPPAEPERIDLTVVIVTRNEEGRIAECIRTTIEAVDEAKRAGAIRTAEYVLVDSASTDRTIDIASRFPVRIVALEPTWPLSAGAGCFVGLKHARGTYTAIINGDMRIDRNWFVGAFPHMGAEVAGVCGVATEELPGRTVVERAVRRYSVVPELTGPLPSEVAEHPGGFSTGTILLRTEPARAVGSYNPFFRAAEDMDLRYRLVRAGWKVLNVPVHQGLHFWSSGDEPLDVLTYFRTIYRNSVGLGQMARYELPRDRWVARRAVLPAFNVRLAQGSLAGLVLVAIAAVNALAAVTQSSAVVVAAAGLDVALAVILAALARRTRIPFQDYAFSTVFSPLAFSLVRTAGFLRGFVPRPRNPADYPKSERIVTAHLTAHRDDTRP